MSLLANTAAQKRQDEIATYDVRELMKEDVRARLVLDGQSYYLRITRAGKLILTK